MPINEPGPELPISPSGIARFAGGILEVKTSRWVEPEREAALRQLDDVVMKKREA
jgi:hypothetical protein